MPKYINADYLLKNTHEHFGAEDCFEYVHVDDIQNAPAADVAPVVHAHWEIKAEPPEYSYMTIVCSNCKEEYVVECNNEPFMAYCCTCGAKMDEED